jgi:hypothetical protein
MNSDDIATLWYLKKNKKNGRSIFRASPRVSQKMDS